MLARGTMREMVYLDILLDSVGQARCGVEPLRLVSARDGAEAQRHSKRHGHQEMQFFLCKRN